MKLNVFGEFYEVISQTAPFYHEEKEVDGLCDSEARTLDVVTSQDPDVTDTRLIHELTHAICFEGGLFQVIPRKIIEIICEHVSKVMVKNFKLIPKDP